MHNLENSIKTEKAENQGVDKGTFPNKNHSTYLLLCQGQGSSYSSSEEEICVRFKLGSA